MNIIEEFKKLEGIEVFTISLLFLSVISSGFLIIYLYKPNLIAELNVIKLIIFSIALSLPMVLYNFLLFLGIEERKHNTFENIPNYYCIGSSGGISFIISYVAILIDYVFQLPFSGHLISVFILELLFTITMGIIYEDLLRPNRVEKIEK